MKAKPYRKGEINIMTINQTNLTAKISSKRKGENTVTNDTKN